ncbi:hypothetical protein IH992_26200 [Candidatus Poribacteria bacterium]|nr:hypothetical protein [Candidatus Poribacteria bacterium]
MSLEAHLQKLHRITHQVIADRMRNEPLIGAALDGSLATGRIWQTSDIDFSIFSIGESEYNQSVEWRVYQGVLAHVHVTHKRATDNLIENYPHSFVESAKSGYFTADPTWFLDGLAVMSIVDDPTGYLEEVKHFVSKNRFAPEVLSERLRLMIEYVDGKIEEAEKAFTDGDHNALLRHLYDKTGLACSMAHIWLEASQRIYSSKEQDLQLALVAQETKLPQVHDAYRAILGIDVQAGTIKKILAPIEEYGKIVDEILQFFEDNAMDHIEWHRAYRLLADLSFKSIPIAFRKKCYSHIAFLLNRFGPNFIDGLIDNHNSIAPRRSDVIQTAAEQAKVIMAEVWEFLGHIKFDQVKMRHQLDEAIRLAEMTRRLSDKL